MYIKNEGDYMGGQDGVRGYVYQGIVAIIKALGENGWNKISVEYNSAKDKVDIALLNDEIIVSAVQVKSSINLFSKREVVDWLNLLISDVSAKQYELILIGSPDKEANVFINSIKQYYHGVNTQKMRNSLNGYETTLDINRIEIHILPFYVDMLLANVRDTLNQFIESQGYNVKHSILIKLTELILGADMLLATEGKYISRQDYESRIIDWLDLSCGQSLKNSNQFSSIQAMFYLDGEFTDRIKPLQIRDLQSYVRLKQNNDKNLRSLISEISGIDVYEEDSPIVINGKQYVNVKDPLEKSDIAPVPYVIEKELTDGIIRAIDMLLGIKLKDDFFDLGDLKQRKSVLGKTLFVGTEKQKRKEKLIWDLVNLISKILGNENYITVFENVKILPIVLKNNGRITDKNITFTLKISSGAVCLLDLQNITNSLCTDFQTAKMINDEQITETIWTPIEDEQVGWEGIDFVPSMIDAKRYINSESLSVEKEKVLEELQEYLQYDITYDNSDNVIIKEEIDSLRPDEAVMLGKYVVFGNLLENVIIEYSILSQEASGRIEGKLFVE